MKNILLTLFLLLFFQYSYAVSDLEITDEQCRAASNEIIKISEDSLPMADDKKKAEKLIKQIKKWKERLQSNENACDIYQSILKSSTNS